MATTPLVPCRCIGTVDGGPPTMVCLKEGASQDAKKGEIVYISGGYIVECGDNPALILGILAEDCHNGDAGANEVNVYLADNRNLFEANNCSAAATRAVNAITDVGAPRPIYRDTTNSKVQVGSASGGANNRVLIWNNSSRDAVGDTGGRNIFMFMQNFFQLGSTS